MMMRKHCWLLTLCGDSTTLISLWLGRNEEMYCGVQVFEHVFKTSTLACLGTYLGEIMRGP